jgi:hypothetical protein
MNILNALKQAQVDWDICPVEVTQPSRRTPGASFMVSQVRVRLTQADGYSVEELVPQSDGSMSITELLLTALRNKLPNHPVFQKWLESRGHVPVVLTPDSLGEGLGECLHVALRKAVDTPESVVQWNAVHHLAPEDWSTILRLVREEVSQVQSERNAAGKALHRYHVGCAIRKALTERLREARRQEGVEPRSVRQRTGSEVFAMRAFEASCASTDLQDYVWGWTYFLCNEVPSQVPSEVN